MRKVIGSISLIIMLFNTILTPITYAGEDEERIVEIVGDRAIEQEVEVKEGEKEEKENAPEFSVEEKTEEGEIEDEIINDDGNTFTEESKFSEGGGG